MNGPMMAPCYYMRGIGDNFYFYLSEYCDYVNVNIDSYKIYDCYTCTELASRLTNCSLHGRSKCIACYCSDKTWIAPWPLIYPSLLVSVVCSIGWHAGIAILSQTCSILINIRIRIVSQPFCCYRHLIDASAAFDTVSHKFLLECLNYAFGVSDEILDCSCPHILTTVINSFNSATIDLHLYRAHPPFLRVMVHVLTALLLIAHVAPVRMSYPCSCGMDYHQFADDTHLLITVRVRPLCGRYLRYCRQTVVRYKWTFMLNTYKSEVMLLGTSPQLKSTLSVNVVTVYSWFVSTCHN